MAAAINHCPVRWQAIHNGQNNAIKCDQQSITYQQLDYLLETLEIQLNKQVKIDGMQQAPRIICIAKNTIELLLIQLLCLRLGWLFCPLNPRFSKAEINQRTLLLNSDFCWVEPGSPHAALNTLQIELPTLNPSDKRSLQMRFINPKQASNIIFTSGSSGLPKAIVHHYQNHFFSALGSQIQIPLTMHDHNLLSLPVFHIGGYATVIRTIIAGGCLHLTAASLNMTLLKQRAITHLSLVSTQLILLLEDPSFQPSRCALKHILLGGSAFSEHLLQALATREFNYHLSYGSTEMASQVATSSNNSKLQLLPYRQVKIKEGEIYVRGETRFMGYLQHHKIVEIDPNEWIASSDMGQLNGLQLIISGRKDRQFISGGENIQPEEIEHVCRQLKQVKQVYACPIKDQKYGYRVALFVEFYCTEDSLFVLQTEQLQAYLVSQLTRFKQPDHYLPWPIQSENNQALKISKSVFTRALVAAGLL